MLFLAPGRNWHVTSLDFYCLSNVAMSFQYGEIISLYNIWGCVFSVYPFPLWWLREYTLCLIIIIKSEVWTIIHCLGLGHETMLCAVCLSIFLSNANTWKKSAYKRLKFCIMLNYMTLFKNSWKQLMPLKALRNIVLGRWWLHPNTIYYLMLHWNLIFDIKTSSFCLMHIFMILIISLIDRIKLMYMILSIGWCVAEVKHHTNYVP